MASREQIWQKVRKLEKQQDAYRLQLANLEGRLSVPKQDETSKATLETIEKHLSNLQTDQNSHGTKLANLEGQLSVPKPDGWMKKHSHWIALLAFLLGSGALVRFFSLTVDERIGTKLETPLRDFHQLQVEVGKISATLNTFIGLEQDRLKKFGEMKPPQFQGVLPSVRDALQDAVALKINIPAQVHSTIKANFQQVKQSEPEYWSAVGEYITYGSAQRSGFVDTILPSCRTVDPRVIWADRNHPLPTRNPFYLLYENCSLELEHLEDSVVGGQKTINDLTMHDLQKGILFESCIVVFRNCSVAYNGGPIDIEIRRAVFDNCSYRISLNSPPLQRGRLLIASLLQDDTHVGFSGG